MYPQIFSDLEDGLQSAVAEYNNTKNNGDQTVVKDAIDSIQSVRYIEIAFLNLFFQSSSRSASVRYLNYYLIIQIVILIQDIDLLYNLI